MSCSNKTLASLVAVACMGNALHIYAAERIEMNQIRDTEELWLRISINHQSPEVAHFLRSGLELYAKGSDLERWRLALPTVMPLMHTDEAYYPVNALRGSVQELDFNAQTLKLQVSATAFLPTSQDTRTSPNAPTPTPTGAFLNYDLVGQQASQNSAASGLIELGVFSTAGVGTTSAVLRNLQAQGNITRLESTWTYDVPGALASVRVGDAISRSGAWSLPVRFGGLQWATNFSVRPGFVTFPLPAMSGVSALPSTVDLFINDALRGREALPPGPFSLPNLPVVTGEGELRLVVRDVLGREQVFSERYYASPRLLRSGLSDFAFQTGYLRNNFGVDSNNYGESFVSSVYRRGVNDRVTAEVSGEVMPGQQTIGVSCTALWEQFGVFTVSAAGSKSARGTGSLSAIEFERQSRHFGLNLRLQATTEDFVQMGMPRDGRASSRVSEARMGFPLHGAGTVGVGYVDRRNHDQSEVRIASFSYQVKAGPGSLLLSAFQVENREGQSRTDRILAVTFTLPLDGRTSMTTGAQRQTDQTAADIQLQRNLPVGDGVGYRVFARSGASPWLQAGVSAQTAAGVVSAEVANFQSDTAYRLSAAGAMVWLDGQGFLTRRLNESFALVRVGDYAGVQIYADNQPVARTDAQGFALVPRLRAYDRNQLRVEQADLPLDAEISTLEHAAVPYYRSGVVVNFPVRAVRAAQFRLVLDGGQSPPPGTRLHLDTGAESFPLGLGGEAYLTSLTSTPIQRGWAEWNGQRCAFDLRIPQTTEPIPHLGTVPCKETQP